MSTTFYSNGKLFIAGEYLVLDGADAFALPTKFGQDLVIEDSEDKQIDWNSYDHDNHLWFKEIITFEEVIKGSDPAIDTVKSTLVNILHEAYVLNPKFIDTAKGYKVSTHLSFPKNWGLGTSSTLINNIAQWTEINAFTLLKNSFGGSGYDIACAQNNTPVLYRIKDNFVEQVEFNPDFKDQLYFVYLNKKQNSKSAIYSYNNHKSSHLAASVAENNKITDAILHAKTLKEFASAIQKHEIHLSKVLEMQTIKEAIFPDFNGVIKSLGAWGGDFILVVSKENPKEYFFNKGYETILTYDEMIL
ncbi:GYDIA family GHMP kinase [Flavobacterium anhuiense]|uniref:GYDIA family GHMP kinase n=1 Tax=Flavobacterium anhuiense TaxID=459526 RepID=UPI003D9924C0